MRRLTNTLILIALLMLVAICASAQVTYVSIHAPCTQTANLVVGVYSGPLAIVPWQLGIMAVNMTTGAQTFRNGVWRAMLGGCSGRSDLVWDQGDCWQSVVNLTATNGTPKWLVSPGAPDCWSAAHPQPQGMNGLFYWKWDGQKYVEQSLISPPTNLRVDRLSTAVLAGDTAWVKLTQNVGWVPCDLNAGTCLWTSPQPSPPSGEGRQAGVGGFSYNVGIDYAHPPENGGPVYFWMARSDQPTPTRPPAPTNTKTPTGGIPSKTPTPDTRCFPFGSAFTCTPTPRLTATATPSKTPTPAASRWKVDVVWASPSQSGSGVPFCSTAGANDYSSNFWFFQPGRTEVVVNLINGCSQNGYYWLFMTGLTNVQVDVTVQDLITGYGATSHNPQGTPFPSVQNTTFERCQ